MVGVRGIRGVEAGFGRVDDGDYPDRGWRSVVRTLRSCGRASKGIGRDACVMWRVEVVKRREGVCDNAGEGCESRNRKLWNRTSHVDLLYGNSGSGSRVIRRGVSGFVEFG